MSDITDLMPFLDSPDREIGKIIIEFYDTMNNLQSDPQKVGKQATKIIMTINDLTELMEKHYK